MAGTHAVKPRADFYAANVQRVAQIHVLPRASRHEPLDVRHQLRQTIPQLSRRIIITRRTRREEKGGD